LGERLFNEASAEIGVIGNKDKIPAGLIDQVDEIEVVFHNNDIKFTMK